MHFLLIERTGIYLSLPFCQSFASGCTLTLTFKTSACGPFYLPSGWFPALLLNTPDPAFFLLYFAYPKLFLRGIIFNENTSTFMLHAWRLWSLLSLPQNGQRSRFLFSSMLTIFLPSQVPGCMGGIFGLFVHVGFICWRYICWWDIWHPVLPYHCSW